MKAIDNKAKIFLVDDDDAVRKGLSRLLKAAGYVGEAFASAEDFWAAVPPGSQGILLLDLRMPGIGGFELQKRVQALCPQMSVVFITGHLRTNDRKRVWAAGVKGLLIKPFTDETLLHLLESVISEKKQEKEVKKVEKQWTCADDILCGVNIPKAPENLTDLEKKHLPVIEAPERVKKETPFPVKVTVGKLLTHPNEPAHFIEWVELYSGDTFLSRAGFSGGMSLPEVVFTVTLTHAHGPLRARMKCNLHGLWEDSKPVIVE